MIRVLSKKSNLFLLTYILITPPNSIVSWKIPAKLYVIVLSCVFPFIYVCIYECILLYLKASFSNLVCVYKIWQIIKSFAGIFRTAQTLKFGRVILLSRRNFFTQTIWWEIGCIRKTLICGENTYENVL